MDLLESVYERLEPALELLAGYDAGILIPDKPSSVIFLSCAQVLELHDKFSNAPLRSHDLLESAVARPVHTASYTGGTIYALAALLGEGIIRNHPFVDGNKRTALLAMGAFLAINGMPVPENAEQTARLVIAMAERRISADDAGELLFRIH